MKFIDWFAGIGGFRRGMELAGHECVGFCEFDKYAVMSYTAMHLCTQEQLDYLAKLPLKKRQKEILKDEYKNGEWYADDVRRVDARDIPEADCWCFGFPCQDISVAGKGIGFNGKRSSLFFEVMRLLDEREANGLSRPGYLFIENVKNLLSVNRGGDFAKVLFALDERGYDAEWQVLNSKNFNVPQNRERVFVVGHLRGRSTTEVFPVEGADGTDSIHGVKQVGQLYGTESERNPSGGRVYDNEGLMRTLGSGHGMSQPMSIEVIGTLDSKRHSQMDVVGSGGAASDSYCTERVSESRVIPVGNTNPSGKGMNGNCYFSEGINPTLTCNKNEGNRVAVPVGNKGGRREHAESSDTGTYP